MAYYKDQTQFQISLKGIPKRIISLVPSQTELLHYLGLEEEVIGITKFCIHPRQWFQSKERVGGTKKLNIEKIRQLRPDLILGNKEENAKDQIEALRKEFPVWLSDINNLQESYDMISSVGTLTNREENATRLIQDIISRSTNNSIKDKRVLYFIWNKPMMTAGKETFIDSMLSEAGFMNALSVSRYPEISENEVQELHPDYIFLSSEPFPFKEKHRIEYQSRFSNAKVILVDGELFSWYGCRLLKSFDYFRKLNEQLSSL